MKPSAFARGRGVLKLWFGGRRQQAKALLCSFDPPSLRGHLGLPDRCRSLNIDDDSVVEVDQIIARISVEG